MEKGVWRWGKREIMYLSLHCQCHHQNDSCVKMGTDQSHFKCFINIMRDKITGQCPQTTAL